MSSTAVAKKLWNYLTGKGFSDSATAAIIGNADQESGLNPSNTGWAYGLFQFEYGGVYNSFISWCSKNSRTKSNWKAQTDYLLSVLGSDLKNYSGGNKWTWYIMSGTEKNPVWSGKTKTITSAPKKTSDSAFEDCWCCWGWKSLTLSDFKQSTDVSEATNMFCRCHERASIPRINNRIKYAQKWFKKFNGTGNSGSGGDDDGDSSGGSWNLSYAYNYTLKDTIFDPEVVKKTTSQNNKSTSSSTGDTKSGTSSGNTNKNKKTNTIKEEDYPKYTKKKIGKTNNLFVTVSMYKNKKESSYSVWVDMVYSDNKDKLTKVLGMIDSARKNKKHTYEMYMAIDLAGGLRYASTTKQLDTNVDNANKQITSTVDVCGSYDRVYDVDITNATSLSNLKAIHNNLCKGKYVWIGKDDMGVLHYSCVSEASLSNIIAKANREEVIPANDGSTDETKEYTEGTNTFVAQSAESENIYELPTIPSDLANASMIQNYIYFYHLDKFFVLPTFAESVTDSISVNYQTSQPLGRSAPIYSYAGSGPRSIQFTFDLHRDMMTDINYKTSNVKLGSSSSTNSPALSDDYVDVLASYLQGMALPKYSSSDKMVNPPMVAVRLGNDIFIKGVLSGAVSVTYKLPILRNNKYSTINISFTINEVDPWGALNTGKNGSMRGISTTLESKLFNS